MPNKKNKDIITKTIETPAQAIDKTVETAGKVVDAIPTDQVAQTVKKTLNSLNPLPLADILFRKDKRVQLFLGLSLNKRIELLGKVTRTVKKDILTHIPDEDLVDIIEAVDPDELTGNDDDEIAKPEPGNEKREVTPAPAAKPPAEDLQMKKALELLKDKAVQRAA